MRGIHRKKMLDVSGASGQPGAASIITAPLTMRREGAVEHVFIEHRQKLVLQQCSRQIAENQITAVRSLVRIAYLPIQCLGVNKLRCAPEPGRQIPVGLGPIVGARALEEQRRIEVARSEIMVAAMTAPDAASTV